MTEERKIIGQRDDPAMPRYAGIATFALLPRLDEVEHADLAVLGIPLDSGTSFRPGARFGPAHIREHSRQLHPYHQVHETYPFRDQQVVDAGDVAVAPYDLAQAVERIHAEASRLVQQGTKVLALGGDHTVALPLLRAAAEAHGALAVIHFDAHLDTWDVLHGASLWHGSPFRRAAEEGLLDLERCQHVGIRSGVYGPDEFDDDRRAGFELIRSDEFQRRPMEEIAEQVRRRVGAVRSTCRSTSTCSTRRTRPARARPRSRASPPANCSPCSAGSRACPSSAATWSRSHPRTTTPASPASPPRTPRGNC